MESILEEIVIDGLIYIPRLQTRKIQANIMYTKLRELHRTMRVQVQIVSNLNNRSLLPHKLNISQVTQTLQATSDLEEQVEVVQAPEQ